MDSLQDFLIHHKMITVDAIVCGECLVTIYSRATHDFHRCLCKAVAVDGGFEYSKFSFDTQKPYSLKRLKVNATKKQLWQDWNNSEDKFGWIYPQISNHRKTKRQLNRKIVPELQEASRRKKRKRLYDKPATLLAMEKLFTTT